MKVRELINELLDHDMDSEILIRTDRKIQGHRVTIESNEIKNIIPATDKYPTKYAILQCEFIDKKNDERNI